MAGAHGESLMFVERLLRRMDDVNKVCSLNHLHGDMGKIEASRWHRLRASRLMAEYLLHLDLRESAALLAGQYGQKVLACVFGMLCPPRRRSKSTLSFMQKTVASQRP